MISKWWRRHLGREFYKAEIRELRRNLIMQGVAYQAMEELYREKQKKVNRLLDVMIRMGAGTSTLAEQKGASRADLRHESINPGGANATLREYSDDFQRRQNEYEETGTFSRQERAGTTHQRPED